MGFNERNFQRAQENFQQLAQQLNEFTQWALEELKSRDRELKETQIHLKMAKTQIDSLVGELADAKREIEDLNERLAESGQVIAMPTKEIIPSAPQPEETYDELLKRASFIQKQMGDSESSVEQNASFEGSRSHKSSFEIDLEQSGSGLENPSAIHASTRPSEHVSHGKSTFAMDLREESGEPSLVDQADSNFFAPAISALEDGDQKTAVDFLLQRETEWQNDDPETIRFYFDFMDRLIVSASGQETLVRDGFVQMIRFAVARQLFDSIRTFMKLNHASLETILLSREASPEILMDLSVLYFQMSMKYEFKHWMRINRDDGYLQKVTLRDDQSWALLYMALFFDQDAVIKENLQGMKAKILLPIPEAKLYREYADAVHDGRNVQSALDQFDDRSTFMRYVDDQIRERVFPMMKEQLQAKAEQMRLGSVLTESESIETQSGAVTRPDVILVGTEQADETKLQKVETVYLVGGEGRSCPVDDATLTYQEVSLKTFHSKSERDLNQNGIYQKVRLLHCSKCNQYYINQFIRWGITGFIRVGTNEEKQGHQIG
jgi:regulator of replication initiation timing